VVRTVVDMESVSEVNDSQANCHWSLVNWLFCKSCVSSSICWECCSKNSVWKIASFSLGIGLRIRGGGSRVGIGSLAISVFGGIWR